VLARQIKALADPTRIQILAMIKASADQATCVCDMTEPLGVSQPTVSHHLKVLVDAGILHREKRGTWAWFSIREDSRTVADTVTALLTPR
jgi:ArsR family transcriptional regulator